MSRLPKRHLFHGMLLAYLFAYSFRLTPDQWGFAESFCPQNKAQTEAIKSDSLVYTFFNSPEENRFAIARDNRESSYYETPDFTLTHGVCGVDISAAERKKHRLMTEYLPLGGRAFGPGTSEPRLPGLKARPHEDKITPQCYIGISAKACYSSNILTSADRIITFQHRATRRASSSDDDLLS